VSYDLSDYVQVADRCGEFFDKWPNGSLQAEAVLMEGGWLVTARAFRTPDDPCPGVGHAFQVVPGTTPYTRGSELENAETSAWGRAIVAVGIPAKKIATREDVQRVHAGDPSVAATAPRPAKPKADKPKPKPEPEPEPAPAVFKAPAGADQPQIGVPYSVTTSDGKPAWEIVSHVTAVYTAHSQPGAAKEWTRWDIKVAAASGSDLKIATFSEALGGEAERLSGTTCRIVYTEQEKDEYTNRALVLIEQHDGAAELVAAAVSQAGPDDDIPF